MEVKKSPEADLEKYRATWLMIGYVVALSIVFIALEWTSQDVEADTDWALTDLVFEEELDIPLTEYPVEAPPSPPPPLDPPLAKPEQLTLVDEDLQIEKAPTPLSEMVDSPVTTAPQPVKQEKPQPTEEEAFLVVDELPEFPQGGINGLMRYLTQHIRYPLIAQKNRIQGRVLCQFIVNADGSIADVQVLSGVHPALNTEAQRVLRAMPRWKPGKREGKPVRVRYTLPVEFRLQ